jgi:hypothetical protein
MVSVVMHFNPKLPHQVRHAEAFMAAGVKVTPFPHGDADVHIVSGPYFALPTWRDHPNVIWLDRAFYGDPEYVSIGWLNPDGSRTFATGDAPRFKPELKPWKSWNPNDCRVLILPDYQQDAAELMASVDDVYETITVRRHPAESGLKSGEQPSVSLASELETNDYAIGHSSTALFDAVVAGLPVLCTDPLNVVAEVAQTDMGALLRRPDRTDWLHRVSWMQWNHDEFGQALQLLLAQRGFAS